MANYIAVFNNLRDFYSDFLALFEEFKIHTYAIEYKNNGNDLYEIKRLREIKTDCLQNYILIFSSKEFALRNDSFYSDENCIFIVEATGGRDFDKDIEQIKLRIVSKNPDSRIKSFFEKLQKLLKKDESYGIGVEPSNNRIYSRQTYYKKDYINGKNMWFDYSLKIGPTIPTLS